MAIKDTHPITLSVTVRAGPRSEAWNALWRWLLAPEPLASPSIAPAGTAPIAARRPRAATPRPKKNGGGADAA
jgi:hypothetical protein